MIFKLVLQGLRRGKARFACAVAGMSVAVGALVFMTSLVATNNAQAPRLAETACAPWAAWRAEGLQLDRPRKKPPTDAKAGARGGRTGRTGLGCARHGPGPARPPAARPLAAAG